MSGAEACGARSELPTKRVRLSGAFDDSRLVG